MHRVRYRDLTLEEDEHAAVEPSLAADVLAEYVIPKALEFLGTIGPVATWLARCELLAAAMPERGLPAIDDEGIAGLVRLATRGKRSLEETLKAPWVDLLRGRLTYAQARLVDEEAPETIAVPSGNRVAVQYMAGKPPKLAVRLQELFGWIETPRIAGGRVPVVLELLGPNFRPVQVTDDLRSFWSDAYFQVRKDLRNRYPKQRLARRPAHGEGRGERWPWSVLTGFEPYRDGVRHDPIELTSPGGSIRMNFRFRRPNGLALPELNYGGIRETTRLRVAWKLLPGVHSFEGHTAAPLYRDLSDFLRGGRR